jgi:hypothetical protein
MANITGAVYAAELLNVKGVMSPKEQIYFEFPTKEKHFVLMVRREGKMEGTGILNGVPVVEYGRHDIYPGKDGIDSGYIKADVKAGSQAFIQWEVRATFISGPEGKPILLDNGVWHFIGGTGSLEGINGAGTMHIKAVSPADREFSFEGQYSLPGK